MDKKYPTNAPRKFSCCEENLRTRTQAQTVLWKSSFFEDKTPLQKNVKPAQKQSMGISLHDEVENYLAKFLDLSNEARDKDFQERCMTLSAVCSLPV